MAHDGRGASEGACAVIAEHIRKEIIEGSLVSCGDYLPWQVLFQKKKLTVGFMGGSITEGYAQYQVYEKAYPRMFMQGLAAQGYDTEMLLCASAGMDTMQGNILSQHEIIDKSPDLVFLEYAINETTLRHSVLSFESLLRKLLDQEHPPIVCILIVRTKAGYSCESFMRPIAEHYGLPCVCLPSGISAPLAEERLAWEEYADAESHPTPDGHHLLAECLLYLIENARECKEFKPFILPEPWLDAPFEHLQWLGMQETDGLRTNFAIESRTGGYYPTIWKGTAPDGEWVLEIEARAIVLVFEAHRLPEYGSAKVLVDGKEVTHPLVNQSIIHGNSIYGWGNAMPLVVLDEETPRLHRITLNVIEQNFYLYGVGIVL